MDWQRFVLEVALEVDPATGLLAYTTVGLSVGRQEGKSSLIDALALMRAATRPHQSGIYICQDRIIARDRVLELAEGPAARYVAAVRRSNGAERVTFRNRSRWAPVAGTGKSGRSRSVDLVVVDEAALLPFDVIDAAAPTQLARPDPQLWIVSNAGDETSLMFWHYTELGREAAGMDPGAGVAWFEWGATDDDDRADPVAWERAMPALDVTIRRDFVAAKLVELAREPARFDREYINRWPAGMGAGPGGVDLAGWRRAAHPRTPITGPRVLAVDVALDRTSATIAAAGADESGRRVVVEVLAQRPGTGWVLRELRRLRSLHRGARVVADDLLAASVVLELRAAHIPVESVSGADFARACVAFDDGLATGLIAHRGQAVLDEAVVAAARRVFGDGWAWSRTRSTADIAPLVAAALAAWAWRSSPPAPTPTVRAGALAGSRT